MTQVALVQWPCGCVIDLDDSHPEGAEDEVVYSCKWCDADFTREDLQRWYKEADVGPLLVSDSRHLVRIGKQVFEAEECDDCDGPLVRECVRGSKWVHLVVPMKHVEVLRD